MSDSDKDVFLKKDLNEYVKECERNFDQHKFEYAETGLKIGHTIINEFLNKRISATPQGQKVSANNEDIFAMLNVLAKTNATAMTSLKRAKYHEDLTRTLTGKLNNVEKHVKEMEVHFDGRLKELEGKEATQSTSDDIVKGLADLLKINGPKTHIGGHKPVSEHKAVQQLKSFTGDRSKFRVWNESCSTRWHKLMFVTAKF